MPRLLHELALRGCLIGTLSNLAVTTHPPLEPSLVVRAIQRAPHARLADTF